MTPEEFRKKLLEDGIEISDHQLEQFEIYFKELVETNKVMNLTSITEKDQVYLKHFYDSIILGIVSPDILSGSMTLCDVGSGAGFPSIPLKIINPQLKITIIDSLNKRIKFLDNLVNKLGLEDVNLVHARAEEFGKSDARESFDIVTARAVAALNILAEFCLPLTKVGGKFVALKAEKASQEIEEGKYAVDELGGEISNQIEIALPNNEGIRNILFIDKIKETPAKYPRKPGTPVKKPLTAN
ncbi:16S rRNA (guanine(527)-N(7))-methyltransferase RsmG [Companilactobacillus metriopterae]|uniref:16S rRNA (guanine(527)-N(7))-methyltransferase RsmG n=1 Tax=Companilactobacillus metriopterae TaxID=1909267 RepID=UPI00100C2895|nr:16S rRNA (guanine(527)-N(7))-methyltransferase RsmG [Companilactobacillus metriopterae]